MRQPLYIATIAKEAPTLAKEFNIGLELDDYLEAKNMMGDAFSQKDQAVRAQIAEAGHPPLLLHAPFNELHPAAIDKEILQIAQKRYNRAYEIASAYHIKKIVVHSGYIPYVYFKEWHHHRSVEFWNAFIKDKPDDFIVCIENILEDEPDMMVKMMEDLNKPNLRLCLDVGHAAIMSKVPVKEWLQAFEPWLGHLHLHNNNGEKDLHAPLAEGKIPMLQMLEQIDSSCSEKVSITIESMDGRTSLEWMQREGFLV